jgi:hypothetical protein
MYEFKKIEKLVRSQAWWYRSVIPALWELRWNDHKFKASQST